MENFKRDHWSRRACFVLNSLLAIIGSMVALTLISLPAMAGDLTNKSTDHISLTITGKITDDKGVPVSEATIAEKGTNNITMSKADGTFTITVVNEKAVLVISHVGYTRQEVADWLNRARVEDVRVLPGFGWVGSGRKPAVPA